MFFRLGKSLAEFAPAGAKKVKSFSLAACTAEKIPLGPQTCAHGACAAAGRNLFQREPNAVGLVGACVKTLFDTRKNTAGQPACGVFLLVGYFSSLGFGCATRKIMRGVSVLAFVFGAMDSVMNELPPMTEFAPMTVLPPRMDAPE